MPVPVAGGHLLHDLVGVFAALGRDGQVVLASERRNVAILQPDVLQRRGADRGERALPDRALVVEGRVRVTRKRHRVRVGRERGRGGAVVVPPHPVAVARVLGRRMLDVEERLGRIERRAVRGEPVRHLRHADFVPPAAMVRDPVRAHERIALHFLAPHRRVRLVEAALPGRGEVLVDGVVVGVVAEQVPRGAVRVALVVVVAVDEQALDAAPVRREVVREHLVPHPGHGLKLLDQPVVGHVPADHDSVHAPVAEPLQRAAERRLPGEHERAVRAADREMDVRDDAEHEVRRAARKQSGRRAQDARGTHRGGHPADKPSTRNVHSSEQETTE